MQEGTDRSEGGWSSAEDQRLMAGDPCVLVPSLSTLGPEEIAREGLSSLKGLVSLPIHEDGEDVSLFLFL